MHLDHCRRDLTNMSPPYQSKNEEDNRGSVGARDERKINQKIFVTDTGPEFYRSPVNLK